MALTRALAGDGEQISKTELTVTSALAQNVKVFLPVIDNGTNGDVVGTCIGFEANSTGSIMVLDNYGHLIVTLSPGDRREVVAIATDATGLVGVWKPVSAGTQRRMIRAEDKLVNGTVAAVLTANGPAGMGTAVAGWTQEVLPDGTIAKRPYWV